MDGSGSGAESTAGGEGPTPGDIDENCPGTLDPGRVYVAYGGDHAVTGLLLTPVDDPEEVCIAGWGTRPDEPFIFRVRPTDGLLLAGYATSDGAVFEALGLDWRNGQVNPKANDTLLHTIEATSPQPFFVWGFDGDAIYYSGYSYRSQTGDLGIHELQDVDGNALEPGFAGAFVTITEDGARWGFVNGSAPATEIQLMRTLPTGDVSTFEAPLESNGTSMHWWPHAARVIGDGGWLVVTHRVPDSTFVNHTSVPERWTFGPQGLVIEGAWPEEALDSVTAELVSSWPNTVVLDQEGALVRLVPPDGPSSEQWIAVERAPLDGEFETVLSHDDPVHGDDGEFEVEEILGLVTGQ